MKGLFNIRYLRFKTVLLLGIVLLLVSACTNTKVVLSFVYNRLDNQIRSEFNKLGKFDRSQKAEFEKRLQTFHYWHRRVELPRYVGLISEIRNKTAAPGKTTSSDIHRWFEKIEAGTEELLSCYPAHFSTDLLRTLDNDQINFIERRFANEQRKNIKKHNSKTREERMNKRLKEVVKWSGRIGFDLTQQQKDMLLKAMYDTISMHKEYYALTKPWNKRFFATLRDKKASDYEAQLKKQMAASYKLVDLSHPQKVEMNREIWRNFVVDFEKSLTESQRKWINSYFGKLAGNLSLIAKDKVSFKPHGDAALGCLPNSGV